MDDQEKLTPETENVNTAGTEQPSDMTEKEITEGNGAADSENGTGSGTEPEEPVKKSKMSASAKRAVIFMCVACLLLAATVVVMQFRRKGTAATVQSGQTDTVDQEALYNEARAAVKEIDYAAIYATHKPDEIVAKVGNHDVTWSEYFRFFFDYASQIDDYMVTSTMYYGVTPSWEDEFDATNGTMLKDMPALYAEEDILKYASINGYAKEHGLALSETNTQTVEDTMTAAKEAYCGENASEKAFEEVLGKSYLSRELYSYLVSSGYLYQQMFTDLYGENGAYVNEADAVKYLEDQGYVSANHILFMTIDRSTGEKVDEDTIKSKLKRAQEISEELQGIENVDERREKFLKYKAELDEDTGKTAYPKGYTFTKGTMVTEFENAVNELGEYEVSDPVESTYGYHVIMRLPLSGDAILEYSDAGTPITAKAKYANEDYANKMQTYMDSLKVEYAEGYQAPEIKDYLISDK